jgi:signal transduction histidine kinase
MNREQPRGRDWPLLLGPQAFNNRPEGAIFTVVCVFTLLLITLAEAAAPKHATLGALTFIPVVCAAWLMSRRLAVLVVVIAMLLRALSAIAGPTDVITAVAQLVALPVIAFAARLAAISTIRSRQTERRLTSVSEERRRTAELERAKSDFMRLASHELRGPVAVLRGYLSMLDEGALGELPEPARRVMPVLLGKVQAMNWLVDEMLETARLEDSRLQLHVAPIELGALARGVVANVRHTLPAGHTLRLETAESRVDVVADPQRVTTMMTNLLDNAIKYSPEGGEVVCSVRGDRGKALVAVSDQGIGIEPRDQARLFTRFGRVASGGSREIGGTGLGLYLSRELARLHGGDITVRSEPGRGSTFTIELPLAPANAAADGKSRRLQRRELA